MDMFKRVPVREQEPQVRATNFEEVCLGYNKEEAELIAQYGKEAASLDRRFGNNEGRRQEEAGRGNDGPGIPGRSR